jgi:hypothetical protein
MMAEETKLAEPSRDECTLALLAHVLQLITWWIGPLVIYFVKRESRFVSFHALQALIYQGILFLVSMLMMGSWLALMFSGMLLGEAAGKAWKAPPIAFFIVFALFGLFCLGVWVLTLVLGIVYGMKASRGEWAAYPVIGRWARRLAGVNKGNQPLGATSS